MPAKKASQKRPAVQPAAAAASEIPPPSGYVTWSDVLRDLVADELQFSEIEYYLDDLRQWCESLRAELIALNKVLAKQLQLELKFTALPKSPSFVLTLKPKKAKR